MPLPPFQATVVQFVHQYDLEISVEDRMLDLTSEVGELAKEILKSTNYGKREFQSNESWNAELGDVFFSLICLANTTEINLFDSLSAALTKYQARINVQGEAGSKESI